MDDTANVSGAFERPTLIDYLLVADNEQLDLGLVLHVGRFELGLIGVEAGERDIETARAAMRACALVLPDDRRVRAALERLGERSSRRARARGR